MGSKQLDTWTEKAARQCRMVNQEVLMALELARIHIVPKPWGSTDLPPRHGHHNSKAAAGKVWCERTDSAAPSTALLLKLIFTSEPLSIQAHSADALAGTIGLTHGKREAWYVLSATADARIAVGMNHRLTPAQLRRNILTDSRTLRAGGPRFVLERLALPDGCLRDLDATGETRLFTLTGAGRVASIDVAAGIANFLETDGAGIEAGPDGLAGLVAYVGSNPAPDLFRRPNGTRVRDAACGSQRARTRQQAGSVERTPPARVAS